MFKNLLGASCECRFHTHTCKLTSLPSPTPTHPTPTLQDYCCQVTKKQKSFVPKNFKLLTEANKRVEKNGRTLLKLLLQTS